MRGGTRPGSGRPKLAVTRTVRQLRAFDDEWEIIRRFSQIVKHGDREACEAFIRTQEKTTE